MTFRILENADGSYVIAAPSGAIISSSNGEKFVTHDKLLATESVDYLIKRDAMSWAERQIARKTSSHKMKSMWGW